MKSTEYSLTKKGMKLEIENVILSYELRKEESFNPHTDFADVIIQTKQGKKYVASFFSFSSIAALSKKNSHTGDFLNGKYFWAKSMVLIDECSRNSIEAVIAEMNEEGSLDTAFKLL